ncbi:hypothetical protein ABOM_008888, partial [Aspergillus bombycis]
VNAVNQPLAIIANDPQFVTPYPRFAADPDLKRRSLT